MLPGEREVTKEILPDKVTMKNNMKMKGSKNMKNLRKFFAFAISMVMVLGMTVAAFADTPTYSITAPDNGHTYEAYQIFTGDLADGVLSNVAAGQNAVTGIDVDAALTAITAVANSADTAKLAVIEQYVDLTGTAYKTIAAGTTEEVPAGYYLIKDVDGTQQDTTEAYTLYVVKVVGDVTITPKSGTPTVEKKVMDTNDTTGVTTGWQDSADYDIGDNVPFKLTASIPAAYSTYKDYYLSFNDSLSDGLTLNASSIVVKVDGETITDGYYIYGDQNDFQVVIYDLKAIKTSGAQNVTVEYTAKLNEEALLGSAGNPNVVDLTFSNNPNVEGVGAPAGDVPGTPETPENPDSPDTPDQPENPGTPDKPDDNGKTPEDKVIVFTYKVVANKVTGEGTALVGASFKLEKLDADGNAIKDLGTIEGTQLSTFEWKGIDDGTYKITETATPAGYNSIDPITFTVSATHDVEAANPTLTALSGDTFTGDVATGALTSNIVNNAGTTLPSTGGMGTTLFYVFGSILVLGAGVVLVSKRRMAR